MSLSKITYLIFLLLGVIGLAANAELVGYWSFDEADGVDDLSGNGNDGIIHGKPKIVEGQTNNRLGCDKGIPIKNNGNVF